MRMRGKQGVGCLRHHVSAPMLSLLDCAGIDVGKVDRSLDRQFAGSGEARLRPGHPYVRQLRIRTGLKVVSIGRAYRHLLLEIEQFGCSTPWKYREFHRNNCAFWCAAQIPETAKAGLAGFRLEALIEPHPSLVNLPIAMVEDDNWGLTAHVKPVWHSF